VTPAPSLVPAAALPPKTAPGAPGSTPGLVHTKTAIFSPDPGPRGSPNFSVNPLAPDQEPVSEALASSLQRFWDNSSEARAAPPIAAAAVLTPANFTPAALGPYRRWTLSPQSAVIARAKRYLSLDEGERNRLEARDPGARLEAVVSRGNRLLEYQMGRTAAGQVSTDIAARAEIAAWSDGAELWFANAVTGRIMFRYDRGRGERGVIRRIALSPDGFSTLILVENQGAFKAMHVSAASGKARTLSLNSRPSAVAFNGRVAAVLTRDATVLLWNVTEGTQEEYGVPGLTKVSSHLAFSPDGAELAVSNDAGQVLFFILNAPTPRLVTVDSAGSALQTLGWSGTGRHLVGATQVGDVIVWDLDNRQATAVPRRGAVIHSVAWDRAGDALVWVESDRVRRGEFRGGRTESSETRLRPEAYAAKLAAGGDVVLAASRLDDDGGGHRIQILRLSEAGASDPWQAAQEAAERDRRERLALARQELADLLEVYDTERLIPRLLVYSRDSLEIFRYAGRKWLSLLMQLGDEEATEALEMIRRADAAAKKPVKK
jgi:hypothetical protein